VPRLKSLLAVATWIVVLVAAPAQAAGRMHALLVGVSQYPNLDPALWLDGPKNDVQLFTEYLQSRGVARENLHVLADGVPDAGEPTRKAILGRLDAIAATAQRGDVVILMFAGHGSQQPAKAGDVRNEPDGLDEIFLPRDVGKWDGEIAALPNALTDDELGAAIGRIRDRGVFVWAVFDNCHSGTITRAMPLKGEKDRQVKPEQLGIDPRVLADAAARAASAGERTRGGPAAPESALEVERGGNAARGGFVAFYAAQSQETTPEASLPQYAADAVPRGLFSYTLYQVLSAHPDATYRQAIEQVLQSYQGMGRQQPTPTYEGTGLDNVVFGATPGSAVTQWRLDNDNGTLRLRAGLIHQVTPESVLMVVPLPTSKDGDALGYVKVLQAASNVSEVQPIAYEGKPALDMARLRGPVFARPVDLKVDFSLRASAPAKSAVCDVPETAVTAAIRELQGARGIAQRVRWVGADEPADVRLCQVKGQLLFLDGAGGVAAGQRPQGPALDLRSLTTGGTGAGGLSPLAVELGANLEKIGRVANLSRLAAGIGGTSRLEITLTWLPSCDVKQPGCSALPQPLTSSSRPALREGDKIKVSVTNPLPTPVDLTILYVDAYYGITAMYPDADQGELPRIEPRGRLEFEITANAEPAGFERMLVIGIPVTPQSPQTSFAGLAQQGIAVTAKRGGSSGGLLDMFEEAAFGTAGAGTTRGAPRRSTGLAGSAEISTYSWTVSPR
jgi:hypothetical protein